MKIKIPVGIVTVYHDVDYNDGWTWKFYVIQIIHRYGDRFRMYTWYERGSRIYGRKK